MTGIGDILPQLKRHPGRWVSDVDLGEPADAEGLGDHLAVEIVGVIVAAEGLDLVLAVPAMPGVAVQAVEHHVRTLDHPDQAVGVLGRELRRAAHHVVDLLDDRHLGDGSGSAGGVDTEGRRLVLLAGDDLTDLLAHVLGDRIGDRLVDNVGLTGEQECPSEVGDRRRAHEDGEIMHEVLRAAHDRPTNNTIQRPASRPKGLGGLELIHERAVFRAQLRPFHVFTFQVNPRKAQWIELKVLAKPGFVNRLGPKIKRHPSVGAELQATSVSPQPLVGTVTSSRWKSSRAPGGPSRRVSSRVSSQMTARR